MRGNICMCFLADQGKSPFDKFGLKAKGTVWENSILLREDPSYAVHLDIPDEHAF